MTGLLAFLAPYKLFIIIGVVVAVLGTVGAVAYNKGYSRAEDAAALKTLAIERAANEKMREANAKAAATNALFDQYRQTAEVRNHEAQTEIDTTRTKLATLGRLRDNYRKPTDCGGLPKDTTATSSPISEAAPGELSEEFDGFLKQQAYAADQVAIYAQTCHEWAAKLTSAGRP